MLRRETNLSDPKATLLEFVDQQAARIIGLLPAWLELRLSGHPQIVLDNQRLDPQLQLMLAVGIQPELKKFGLFGPSPAEARTRYRHGVLIAVAEKTKVAFVRDFEIPGEGGPLRVRHYAPLKGYRRDFLVYLHGGGFVMGDLETHDEPCRLICRYAETHVLSVDYRLAPEHPFPAGLNDALAALRWAKENAGTQDAEGFRVAIAGDSAGGNLAAVTAQLAAERGFAPAAQLLIYPVIDTPMTPYPSKQMFGQDFFITREDCDLFFHHYTNGTGVSHSDSRLSPLRAANHSGLPPALIATAGFDLLRDEGEAYAACLREAGTPVRLRRFPSLGHGFIHLTRLTSSAFRGMRDIARDWRALLDSQRPD